RLLVSFATVSLLATSVGAQSIDTQRCPPGTVNQFGVPDAQRASQDACQKAIDLFQYLAPQLGTMIAGGNPTLGQGGTLGGLGHFSAGLRVNVLQGSLPQIDNLTVSTAGAQQTQFDTKDQYLPMPTADLAIGVFKGVPLPLTNVGGIDLLVSASYIPEFDNSGVIVKVPNGSLKLGYGARVGILQESLLVPGIAVSYLVRDLPTLNVAGENNGDSLYVNNLSLKTKAWRVTASKSLILFGLAAGVGQDKYDASTDIGAHVAARPPFSNAANAGPVSLSQSLTRTNIFADLSVNLLLFKLNAEIGQVSGGTINTYNTFSGKQPADSRLYGSVGARFGF
ncbi:MAG TPA: hypothetical protein VJS39_04120, partial [Gemmatimonadaceae bacterium]|nr:hypothetical protein [Gemmatimonadaceae bacterium]